MPDWKAIRQTQPEGLDNAAKNVFWTEQGREWVYLLKTALGDGYIGYESSNFWLISREPTDTCRRIIGWAETTGRKIKDMLKIDPAGRLFGKCPILVVHDQETYFEYFASYLPDGSYAGSGGVYLNRGYGHFVFDYHNMTQAESVLAHELTHVYIGNLPIPVWLNEGAAQLCEISLTKRDPSRYDELKESIGSHWNEQTIQDFWDGSGFLKDNNSQMHCYHLAKVLTARLARQGKRFHAFFHSARASDSGALALHEQWNLTLSDLVGDYLGDGNWHPIPQSPSQTEPTDNSTIIEPDAC